MNFLKGLFLLIAVFSCNCSQAQEFDSVAVDSSTYPGYAHVRIKFPHNGFRFIGHNHISPLIYPPREVLTFYFEECIGKLPPTVTYYDTTVRVYVDSVTLLIFSLCLVPNTTDSNCVIRPSLVEADTLLWGYRWSPGPSSVNSVTKNAQVDIYPNPVANHQFTVTTKGNSPVASVMIYSVQGALLASYPVSGSKEVITLPANLASGNYVVLVKWANDATERKLIRIQ